MPTQLLTWTSDKELSCGSNLPAAVVICVASDLVAQHLCPTQPSTLPQTTPDTSFPWRTIQATMTFAFASQDSCGSKIWSYTITYDDAQLANRALLASDIQYLFCKSGITQYIEDLAGNDVRLVTVVGPPNQVLLISQHGCVYALDALDANGLASGIWGQSTLNLPDCAIDNGEVIYVDDGGRLRAPPPFPYFQPQTFDGGSFSPAPGTIPNDGFVGGSTTVAFTNTSCRDVAFQPFISMPEVVFHMKAGNSWEVLLTATPNYGGPVTVTCGAFSATSDTSINFPASMFLLDNSTIVAPGDTVQIVMEWTFRRYTYVVDSANQLGVIGPRATFIAHAI